MPAVPTTADLIKSIWPAEDRPEELQSTAVINSMSMDTVLALKRCWDEKRKREEKTEDTFKKDADLPTRRFEGGPDNCTDQLHPARWERDPVVEPKAYWFRVPTKRVHCYRRLALEHLGAANMISEHSIIRAHDRTAALEIKMFYSGNYTKKSFLATETKSLCEDWDAPRGILEIQEALLNFAAVQGALWRMDPTPLVLQRVLLTYNFGIGHGSEEARTR